MSCIPARKSLVDACSHIANSFSLTISPPYVAGHILGNPVRELLDSDAMTQNVIGGTRLPVSRNLGREQGQTGERLLGTLGQILAITCLGQTHCIVLEAELRKQARKSLILSFHLLFL